MIDKIKEKIKPDDKIIMAKKDILPLKFPVKQMEDPSIKPRGLWYAIGLEWIKWVEGNMPEWMGNVFYKIEINFSKVLHVKNQDELITFSEKYRTKDIPFNFSAWINWKRVAEDYSGIEISPCQPRRIYAWYDTWSIASGCIWEKDGIISVHRITV
jgi:hypothetical protein